MTLWICFICVEAVHPVTRPLKRIICGHAVCAPCVDLLIEYRQRCPFRCIGQSDQLTPKDARTLEISVVDTSIDEDDLAALQVLQALFEKRNRLAKAHGQNAATLNGLAQRIANQLASLERLTTRVHVVFAERKQTLLDLVDAQEHLDMETNKRAQLMTRFHDAQEKLCRARFISERSGSPHEGMILCEDLSTQFRPSKRRSEDEVAASSPKKRRTV